jgi:hypothetical protein
MINDSCQSSPSLNGTHLSPAREAHQSGLGMLLVSFRPTLAHILPRMHTSDDVVEIDGGGTTSWPVIETCDQLMTVWLTTRSTHQAWHRSEDIPGNGHRASSLTARRCKLDSEGKVKRRTCSVTFPDTAGPFLSDRECSLRISLANGILNVKPVKANSWQRGWR